MKIEFVEKIQSLFMSSPRCRQTREEMLASDYLTMRAALDRIACWNDGVLVGQHFDEPRAAVIAREAVQKVEDNNDPTSW